MGLNFHFFGSNKNETCIIQAKKYYILSGVSGTDIGGTTTDITSKKELHSLGK